MPKITTNHFTRKKTRRKKRILTGTFFCVTTTLVSLPLTATDVSPGPIAALKAYSAMASTREDRSRRERRRHENEKKRFYLHTTRGNHPRYFCLFFNCNGQWCVFLPSFLSRGSRGNPRLQLDMRLARGGKRSMCLPPRFSQFVSPDKRNKKHTQEGRRRQHSRSSCVPPRRRTDRRARFACRQYNVKKGTRAKERSLHQHHHHHPNTVHNNKGIRCPHSKNVVFR